MIRLNGSATRNKLQSHDPIEEEPVVIAESRINGGIVTELDPADITSAQSQVLNNFRVNADKTERAPGKVAITPTKPDSDKVLLYTTFDRFNGSATYLRFTATKVYKKGSGSWTELTAGTPLTATDSDRISFCLLNDRFFFSNGVDPIQEINTGVTAYAALGNAPNSKYIWGFFNRLVGANNSTNPVLVEWSGDLNFDEWDEATDLSAGDLPLIEGQSDFSEAITGGFGFASVSLILREKSLWILTKQPSASNPFLPSAAFPGTGCDCPSSATQTKNGIAWYDYRTNEVYNYVIGGRPEAIGTAIRKQIKRSITDKSSVVGSYDPIKDQYNLLVPSTISSYAVVYTFDYQTKSWHTENITNGVGVYNLADGGSVLTYDDLVGNYEDLVGNYEDLVLDAIVPPNRFYGLSNGDILQDNSEVDTNNGDTMLSEWVTGLTTVPADDINITEVVVKYIASRIGSFTLWFSRDKGDTWEEYKTVTIDTPILNKRRTVIARRNLRVSEYVFKMTSTAGAFELLEYRISGVHDADKTED